MPISLYIIYGCFCPTMTTLNNCDTECVTPKPKIFILWPFKKKFASLWTRPLQFSQDSLWDSLETFMAVSKVVYIASSHCTGQNSVTWPHITEEKLGNIVKLFVQEEKKIDLVNSQSLPH